MSRLGADWGLWLVDNLLAGASPPSLTRALMEAGVPADIAEAEVTAVAGSEVVTRLRARLRRARHAERRLSLHRTLQGPPALDRLPTADAATMRAFHERNRPVLLERLEPAPAALDRWSFEDLAARFADVPVAVNVGRCRAASPARTEDTLEERPFGAWVRQALTQEGDDAYLVSKGGLLARPAFAPLVAELRPLPDWLRAEALPWGASLWLGPAGTHTPLHYDPHDVVLLQVLGQKRVRLVPPAEVALFERTDGYHAAEGLDAQAPRDGFNPAAVLEADLGPGRALFIPVGWWHEVVATTPSLTVSLLGFRWPNDFHGLAG